MKVRIKKTGEIVNAHPNAAVLLEYKDKDYNTIYLPLDEIELIPDDTSSEEIEHRKRIVRLAEMILVSPVFPDTFGRCIRIAEDFIKQEDKYIKEGVL